jgi:WD40 repeat protein
LQEEAPCNSAAFSPEALRIATGSDDGTIKLWAPPGNPPRVFHETRARINNVGFSQNGNYIAAVAGPEVLAWDVHRGTVAARWETPATLGRLAWCPCSDLIGIGGTVLTLKTGKRSDCELSGPHRTGGMGTAFTLDGKLLAGVIDTGTVGIWEVATGRRLAALRPESAKSCWSSCVAFSPDGCRLAIGSGADRYPLPGTMQVWNVKKQQVELTLAGFRDSVVAVTFSPDGSQLAAGIGDARGFSSFTPGEVRIWDAATGAELHRLRGHRHCVYAVSFSPDGQRLATAAGRIVGLEGGEVKFWDLRTGQEVGSLPAFTRCVYGVAFSPCGRRIATAGGDYSVKIWDGTPLAEMPARE